MATPNIDPFQLTPAFPPGTGTVLLSPAPARHLQHLPLELLRVVFSFLGPDSLLNVRKTCRIARRAIEDRLLWFEHQFHLDGQYGSSEDLERVVGQAINTLHRSIFRDDISGYASCVVSVNLNGSEGPISAFLILRILDEFTALREASFCGRLDRAGVTEFLAACSEFEDGVVTWSRALQSLDLSDTEEMVRRANIGPRSRNGHVPRLAWSIRDVHAFHQDCILMAQLPHLSSYDVYPQPCSSCREGTVYSWSSSDVCTFCRDVPLCLACGVVSLDSEATIDRPWVGDLHTWCSDAACLTRTLSTCKRCRAEFGWTVCSAEDCDAECCPLCLVPCKTCGVLAAYCMDRTHKCRCSD